MQKISKSSFRSSGRSSILLKSICISPPPPRALLVIMGFVSSRHQPPPWVRESKINSLISATCMPPITLFRNTNVQYLPIPPSQPHTLLQTCSPSETKSKQQTALLQPKFPNYQMPSSFLLFRPPKCQFPAVIGVTFGSSRPNISVPMQKYPTERPAASLATPQSD